MTGLTDKQKELFQQDKHVLVDTIIVIENKLLEAEKTIKFLNNEMLLINETSNIKTNISNDALLHKYQDTIDKIEVLLDKTWTYDMISLEEFRTKITQLILEVKDDNSPKE